MAIWTSAQLAEWETQAFEKLSSEIPLILERIAIEITAGVPIYSLPAYSDGIGDIVGIQRITWQGKRLIALSRAEFRELYPDAIVNITSDGVFSSTVFDSGAFACGGLTVSGSQGIPDYYSYSGVDWKTIQFWKTPNISISGNSTDLFAGPDIRTKVIATVYICTSDHTKFPDFNIRSFIKPYVLYRAFQKEGPGQRLDLASLWKGRFDAGINVLRKINEGCFTAQRHGMKDTVATQHISPRQKFRGYASSEDVPLL